MPFYLVDDQHRKTFVSNAYLKQKILTHCQSETLLNEQKLLENAARQPSGSLFYQKIGFRIPELTIDSCANIFDTSYNLSDDMISILALEKSHFLAAVYGVKENLFSNNGKAGMSALLDKSSVKTPSDVMISSLRSENKTVDIFTTMFQAIGALDVNTETLNGIDTNSDPGVFESSLRNNIPSVLSENSTISYSMFAALRGGSGDPSGLLKDFNWNFKDQRRVPVPEIKWWEYLTGSAYVKWVWYGLQWAALGISMAYRGGISGRFVNAVRDFKSQNDSSIGDWLSHDILNQSYDTHPYSLKNVYVKFLPYAMNIIGNAIWETRNGSPAEREIAIKTAVPKFVEALRACYSFEVARVLNRDWNGTTSHSSGSGTASFNGYFYENNDNSGKKFPDVYDVLSDIFSNSAGETRAEPDPKNYRYSDQLDRDIEIPVVAVNRQHSVNNSNKFKYLNEIFNGKNGTYRDDPALINSGATSGDSEAREELKNKVANAMISILESFTKNMSKSAENIMNYNYYRYSKSRHYRPFWQSYTTESAHVPAGFIGEKEDFMLHLKNLNVCIGDPESFGPDKESNITIKKYELLKLPSGFEAVQFQSFVEETLADLGVQFSLSDFDEEYRADSLNRAINSLIPALSAKFDNKSLTSVDKLNYILWWEILNDYIHFLQNDDTRPQCDYIPYVSERFVAFIRILMTLQANFIYQGYAFGFMRDRNLNGFDADLAVMEYIGSINSVGHWTFVGGMFSDD